MAGLKTIIALSFVCDYSSCHHFSYSRVLTRVTGSRNRLPPRHPLLGSMAQLPSPPSRRNLRYRSRAKLDMRPSCESR